MWKLPPLNNMVSSPVADLLPAKSYKNTAVRNDVEIDTEEMYSILQDTTDSEEAFDKYDYITFLIIMILSLIIIYGYFYQLTRV